jgi:hypothetical protein
MSEGKTSDKNIVLYLSLWFNAFKELNAGMPSLLSDISPFLSDFTSVSFQFSMCRPHLSFSR